MGAALESKEHDSPALQKYSTAFGCCNQHHWCAFGDQRVPVILPAIGVLTVTASHRIVISIERSSQTVAAGRLDDDDVF